MSRHAEIRWLLDRVGYETSVAPRLMAIAADYLETGERMPLILRAWLATGLREAADVAHNATGQPIEHSRGTALATALGIMRRPGAPTKFVSWRDVRRTVRAYGDEVSETALAKGLAKAYGVGLSTARRHVKNAKPSP